MKGNRLRDALRSGRLLTGSGMTIPDPFVAESMARAGFDFLIVDAQHAPLSIEAIQSMLIAIATGESAAIVRVPSNDPTWIGRVLDLGPHAIIVPLVNSAEEFRAAMSAAKYPPDGLRSWGPRRAARLGGGVEVYAETANQGVFIIPQIESVKAADNLEEILAVPGCEAIMIGPADLAWSMGLPLDQLDLRLERQVRALLEACRKRGVMFGHFTGTVERARHWRSLGAQLTTVGSDVVFLSDGMARSISALREPVEGPEPLLEPVR